MLVGKSDTMTRAREHSRSAAARTRDPLNSRGTKWAPTRRRLNSRERCLYALAIQMSRHLRSVRVRCFRARPPSTVAGTIDAFIHEQ